MADFSAPRKEIPGPRGGVKQSGYRNRLLRVTFLGHGECSSCASVYPLTRPIIGIFIEFL